MKKFKIIISLLLVCVMTFGILTVTKSPIKEPDTNGMGWGGLKDETEEEFIARTVKNQQDKYNRKYSISEEKKQEYRETQVYPDVLPGMWYTEAINAMTDGGLLTGYTDGLFHPDDYITQGQYAKILCEYYGLDTMSMDYGSFTGLCEIHGWHEKTPSTAHWALPYAWDAMWAGAYYTPICGATLDEPLWRGDALSHVVGGIAAANPNYFYTYYYDEPLYQTEKVWTLDAIPDGGLLEELSDIDDTAPTLKETVTKKGHRINASRILAAYNIGATKGIDDLGTCAPMKPMTRAELCQMLYNLGINRKGQAEGYYERKDVSGALG